MRNSHPNVCSLLGHYFLSFSFSFLSLSLSLSFSSSPPHPSPPGICRNGNQLYICMELMSGNLEKYLKVHSGLSPMKRIGIVSQIARGLNWLHNLKVFFFFSFLLLLLFLPFLLHSSFPFSLLFFSFSLSSFNSPPFSTWI